MTTLRKKTQKYYEILPFFSSISGSKISATMYNVFAFPNKFGFYGCCIVSLIRRIEDLISSFLPSINRTHSKNIAQNDLLLFTYSLDCFQTELKLCMFPNKLHLFRFLLSPLTKAVNLYPLLFMQMISKLVFFYF